METVVKSEVIDLDQEIAKSELELKVIHLAEPILQPHGFRVVDLDCRISGTSLVRIFIEKVPQTSGNERDEKIDVVGQAPVQPPSIADCARMSPLIGQALDDSTWFPGSYELEVSSPGLDRRLRVMKDFDRFVGQELKVKLWERLENGGANLSGLLERTEPGKFFLKVGRESLQIPLSKVKQANVVWKPRA